MMRWDPAQYLHHGDERARPFFELVDRIGADRPRTVVDLGCGPGQLTAGLRRRWPDARIRGLDSSAEMIAAAQSAATTHTGAGMSYEVGDISQWRPSGDTDVVISNAALQWVPGHRRLIRQWTAALPSGAWLGFQVPGNFGSPSHRLMRELAESASWRDALAGVLRHDDAVDDAPGYARLLLDCGWSADAWETTYVHILPGEDPVLDWIRGTGLRPVLGALQPAAAAEFEAEYAALLRRVYPRRAEGTLFPFRRIFCVGQAP
jgi:trans-aconitate 2-methyltransferase